MVHGAPRPRNTLAAFVATTGLKMLLASRMRLELATRTVVTAWGIEVPTDTIIRP